MKTEKIVKNNQNEGALGFEPRTYRSAVDCSTTELYPQRYEACFLMYFNHADSFM